MLYSRTFWGESEKRTFGSSDRQPRKAASISQCAIEVGKIRKDVEP